MKPVPITHFTNFIEALTGWDNFFDHDLGDLEWKLDIRAKGEHLGLYRLVSYKERKDTREFVDKLLDSNL